MYDIQLLSLLYHETTLHLEGSRKLEIVSKLKNWIFGLKRLVSGCTFNTFTLSTLDFVHRNPLQLFKQK